MDRFWAARPQRPLCGGELGETSVKTRPGTETQSLRIAASKLPLSCEQAVATQA
jgi:hypothetical protein